MVWKKANYEVNNSNLCSTVKYGSGSIMVWGFIFSQEVGELVFIDGIVDKTYYLYLLKGI